MKKLSAMQESALLEAGNIGSGHAAIALSQLLGSKIMIAIPSIEVLDQEDLEKYFMAKKVPYVAVTVDVYGDILGFMFLALEHEAALAICNIATGAAPGQTKSMGIAEQSALEEISNILISAYLTAIGDLTELTCMITAPRYHLENANTPPQDPKGNVNLTSGKDCCAVCVQTEFIQSGTKIEGTLVLATSEQGVEKILGKMGL